MTDLRAAGSTYGIGVEALERVGPQLLLHHDRILHLRKLLTSWHSVKNLQSVTDLRVADSTFVFAVVFRDCDLVLPCHLFHLRAQRELNLHIL